MAGSLLVTALLAVRTPHAHHHGLARPAVTRHDARMSLIDIGKASDRGKRATASHILLKGPKAAEDARRLKARIEAGELQFGVAAKDFSACGSAREGGNLGSFVPGKMVAAFDAVVFDPATELNSIQLVATDFGVHLIKVTKRTLPPPPMPKPPKPAPAPPPPPPPPPAAAAADAPAAAEDDWWCPVGFDCVDLDEGAQAASAGSVSPTHLMTPSAPPSGLGSPDEVRLYVEQRKQRALAARLLAKRSEGTLTNEESLELRAALASLILTLSSQR